MRPLRLTGCWSGVLGSQFHLHLVAALVKAVGDVQVGIKSLIGDVQNAFARNLSARGVHDIGFDGVGIVRLE